MIKPLLEELRRKREERLKEFLEVQSQIVRICAEIAGNPHHASSASPQVDQCDLTVKRLEDLKSQLQELQKDKVVIFIFVYFILIASSLNFDCEV